MYKEVLEENQVTQTPEFTLSILTSGVGKLHQLYYRKVRFGSEGFLGEERITLGDAIVMAKLLAEQKGFDLDELENEGLERFQDRIREVKKAEIRRKYGETERA